MRRPLRVLAALAVAALGLGGLTPGAAVAATTGSPEQVADLPLVSVPGTHGTALGCAGDWQPECTAARLAERADGVYSATFDIPAGDYEYKVTVNGDWSENYGVGGVSGGSNIAYTVEQPGPVTFYYDPVTHYSMNTAMGPVISLAGSFQDQLACGGTWAADCLAAWLQDADGDGVYTFETRALATGGYQVKVVHGLDWSENYGVDGEAGGANIPFAVSAGELIQFRYTLATHVLEIETTNPPPAGTGQLQAFWITPDTLAVPSGLAAADATWTLHADAAANVAVTSGVVTSEKSYRLEPAGGLSADQVRRFPQLAGYRALRVDVETDDLAHVLRGQLIVSAATPSDALTVFTGVQLAGVLDAVYASSARGEAYGVSWAGGTPTLRLWAPTAQDVAVLLWDDGGADHLELPATRDDATGAWSLQGAADWSGKEYVWAIDVYAPTTQKIERNLVTDPWSIALTTDSKRSVIVDLDDPETRPAIWADTPAPTIANATSRTIYELSVRDFSATDESVAERLRGTYAAFAAESDGRAHLRALAKAGLNTVHLQPTFDFSSVPEDRADQLTPDCDLASFAPESAQQQACIAKTAAKDAFNWGYDPLHFLAPEGSYAVEPDGAPRVAEFRTMVGALHADGLQVVLDQVFNHTSGSGQAGNSVLDRVVPGYYQRLDANGNVYTSTCCQNVATEHGMTGKLMDDTVVLWAKQYHVDGFRFDLMGFNSVDSMLSMRAALDELTLERDGVDGKSIALYGEGWDFGEVSGNALFTQAVQGQLGGTGIGTFSDRLRDAVRGGSPVDGSTFQKQGWGTGLGTASNGPSVNGNESLELAAATDLVKLGLIGNLRDYEFVTADGTVASGSQLSYNGSPAGYADQPDEVVNYVDAHDNQTLFDAMTVKAPVSLSMSDRVRMQILSLATATLSQSPSMWLAGSDMLRSKSLDQNSYDSGDWFNAIDWTGVDNGFGRGLPMSADNSAHWDVERPLLADTTLKPTASDIATATEQAQTLLRLKALTPLFSLGDAAAIRQKVTFPVADGPGAIVMLIDDLVGADADPRLDGALVVFNPGGEGITETVTTLAGRDFALAAPQATGTDPVVKETRWDAGTGTVSVPPRTVAVLLEGPDVPGVIDPVDPVDPGTPVDPGDPSGGGGGASAGGPLALTGVTVPVALLLIALLAVASGLVLRAGGRRIEAVQEAGDR